MKIREISESQLNELSLEKLGAYKKAAGADASKADKAGDFERGNKRFSGIIKATKKEFDKTAKKPEKEVDESNAFTDARMNAIKAGKDSFSVGGKTYKVTGDTSDELAAKDKVDEMKCWSGYTRVKGVPAGAPGSCKKKTNEMDSQTPKGKYKADGTRSHSTYGVRDIYDLSDPQVTLGPESIIKVKDLKKRDAELNKVFQQAYKEKEKQKKGVAEGSGDKVHLKTPKHGLADHPGRNTGVGLRTFAQTPEQDRCSKCNSLFKNHYKQGVAEGLADASVQDAIIDTVERLFHKNNLSDYSALEAIRQGVKHHFSKPGATAESAVEGILNILDKRMRKSGDFLDLGRFKEALRQGVAHQLKKQGVAEGSDKLPGTPVVSLSDFGDKDNKKNKYGQTVPKKLKKDDPRVKFHKEPQKQGVAEGDLSSEYKVKVMVKDEKPIIGTVRAGSPDEAKKKAIASVKKNFYNTHGYEVYVDSVRILSQGVAEGLPGSSQIYDQIESLSDKLKHTSDPDERRFYIKQIKKLEHKLHSTDDPFDIDDPAPIGKKGVAEGQDWSPGAKETIKKDKIQSLKNLIAIYKEKGNHAKVKELQTELKKLQQVKEGLELDQIAKIGMLIPNFIEKSVKAGAHEVQDTTKFAKILGQWVATGEMPPEDKEFAKEQLIDYAKVTAGLLLAWATAHAALPAAHAATAAGNAINHVVQHAGVDIAFETLAGLLAKRVGINFPKHILEKLRTTGAVKADAEHEKAEHAPKDELDKDVEKKFAQAKAGFGGMTESKQSLYQHLISIEK